jgi:Tfp pilus assembly protein PilF
MRIAAALTLVSLLSAGCASNPMQQQGQFDEFYDGRPQLALDELAPAEDEKEALAHGDRALKEGNDDLALFEYVRALEKDNRNTDALFKIGRIHQKRGNIQLASRAYRLVLDIDPKHGGALESLGLIMLENRRYDPAKTYLERAVAGDPSRWRSQNGLGIIADLQGRHLDAEKAYRAGLHVQPRSPRLLNNLGYSQYLKGNHREAVRLYRRALAEKPDYKRAWNNLGLLYASEQRYHEAIKAMSHVMSEAEANNTVGFICMGEKRYDCAEKMFKEAMRRSPHFYVAAKRNLERLETLRTRLDADSRPVKMQR